MLRGASLGFCAEGVLGGVTRRDLLREGGTWEAKHPWRSCAGTVRCGELKTAPFVGHDVAVRASPWCIPAR